MRIKFILNIRKFVKEYNKYAELHNEETITVGTVYKELEKVFGDDLYTVIESTTALMTFEELERFSNLFLDDVWKEIVLNETTWITFFQ